MYFAYTEAWGPLVDGFGRMHNYNNVTYYTTDKKSTYDVSMSTGGHVDFLSVV